MIGVAVLALLMTGCVQGSSTTSGAEAARGGEAAPAPTTTIPPMATTTQPPPPTTTTTTTIIITTTTTTTTTTTPIATTTTITTTTTPPNTAPPTTTTTTTQPPPTTHTVSMGDFFNAPELITIRAGDIVRWVNDGEEVHDVVSGEDPIADGAWSSTAITTGSSWTRTFDAPGTYPYFCQIHAGAMPGTVIVEP